MRAVRIVWHFQKSKYMRYGMLQRFSGGRKSFIAEDENPIRPGVISQTMELDHGIRPPLFFLRTKFLEIIPINPRRRLVFPVLPSGGGVAWNVPHIALKRSEQAQITIQ